MAFVFAFFIWPAVVFGTLLFYGWWSLRQTHKQIAAEREAHHVPGE